jgi:hypothetical protein
VLELGDLPGSHGVSDIEVELELGARAGAPFGPVDHAIARSVHRHRGPPVRERESGSAHERAGRRVEIEREHPDARPSVGSPHIGPDVSFQARIEAGYRREPQGSHPRDAERDHAGPGASLEGLDVEGIGDQGPDRLGGERPVDERAVAPCLEEHRPGEGDRRGGRVPPVAPLGDVQRGVERRKLCDGHAEVLPGAAAPMLASFPSRGSGKERATSQRR